MATIVGPNLMMDPLASDNCDPSPSGLEGLPPNLSSLPSSETSPRSGAPPPNPPFVFPARLPTPTTSSSHATRSRPTSALSPRDIALAPSADLRNARRHSALPDFSFPITAPSGKPAESSFLSPPQSPRATPARPAGAGHRRGGSEFVGGSIRGGDSITVMGTSPTKSDSGLPSPNLAPTKPWRGHAHRRSGAISSHDLSSIIVPPSGPSSLAKGGSAPVSPAPRIGKDDTKLPDYRFPWNPVPPSPQSPSPAPSSPRLTAEPEPAPEQPRPESSDGRAPGDSAASEEAQLTPKPAPRSRVGFSDTLEFIPRPLSLVSSDTASSTATARPGGHSVSGSISSVISLTNTAPASERDAGSLHPPQAKGVESRPSTAGAVLEHTQTNHGMDQTALPHSPRRRSSIPDLDQLRPSSVVSYPESSPGKSPKRWSFFGIEPFAVSTSPARPSSPNDGPTASESPIPDPPTSHLVEACGDAKDGDQKLTGRKRSKRQKRVKTWAGSILSRKPKHRHPKPKRRTPTPPPRILGADDDASRQSIELNTKPVTPTVMVTEPSGTGIDAPESPSYPASVPDDDTSYPMIDLDAALGPFNTPLARNLEWEAAQKAGGLAKKQLHSAAGMSRFTGPGMHYYHRRAESAPEMAPFEAGRFGIPRFGSSSTMADVFEEDEEDDPDADKTTGQSTPVPDTPNEQSDAKPASRGVDAPEAALAEFSFESQLNNSFRRRGSDLSDDCRSQTSSRVRSDTASASLHGDVIAEESEGRDMPRFKLPFATSNQQPESPAPSPRQILRARDLTPVDVSPLQLPTTSQAPVSPYSMTQPSPAFPSPGSYDAQRISTAPSSVTEDNFQSLLMGEPGPEVRISVDDVPSLASSHSTTTRDGSSPHNAQTRQPPLHHHPRPASFTAAAFGRRRSSLVSLSRLINTSHGERSKLSMEVTLDNEPDRKPKVSKTKRLSRMMQFWKPKDTQE